MTDLLNDWLDSVNQPIVDNVQSGICRIIDSCLDNGNFTIADAKKIISEIVLDIPESYIVDKMARMERLGRE